MVEREAILKLISNGHTSEALDKLLTMDLSSEDRSGVVQLKASFEELKNDKIRGILSFEQQTTELNRINDRLLRFLNKKDEQQQPSPTPMVKISRRKVWKYVVGVGVVVSFLAGIFQIAGISLKDVFGGGSPETFSVTVFVHGKKGKDDRILKQGQVMLGQRTNEMPCTINEKGEATFKEIAMGFTGQKVPIRIEHPQPYRATHPDSLYMLEPNVVFYVEVALEGMNVIKGKVMDFYTEQWLDSVRISVENIATYTDQFGSFELEIPEHKQRKFQRVSFFKKGYEIDELDSIPVHTQQEIQISLRKSTKQ